MSAYDCVMAARANDRPTAIDYITRSNGLRERIYTSKFREELNTYVTEPVVEETARKYGVTFYDFEQDTTFIANPEYFNEPFHLNVEGATLYTEKIIPIINRALLQ